LISVLKLGFDLFIGGPCASKAMMRVMQHQIS
jgi:hypothetical protein